MLKLKINPLALQDLREIKEYFTNEFENEKSGIKTIENIITKYEKLVEFPAIGTLLSSKINIKTDFRFLVCNNYIVFYKYDKRYVYIYRILYGKRDYLKVLFNNKKSK